MPSSTSTLRFTLISLAAHAAVIAWLTEWVRKSSRREAPAVEWVPFEWIEIAPTDRAQPTPQHTTTPSAPLQPDHTPLASPATRASAPHSATIRARVIAPAPSAIDDPSPATSLTPSSPPTANSEPITPPAHTPVDVAGLFHALPTSAALGAGANGGTSREQRTQRVRTASQGYLRDLVDREQHMQASGTAGYDSTLRRRLVERWIPASARDPGIVRSLVAGFVSDVDTARNVAVASAGANGAGQSSTVGRAMPSVVDDSRAAFNTPVTNTLAAIEALTERHTYVDIEIDQDPHGTLVHACVRAPSSAPGFDRSALAAVRASVAALPARDITGGRTTRWRFEVIASRTPYVPNRPGAAIGANWAAGTDIGLAEAAPIPAVGGSFDESTGWVQLAIPGILHRRVRIQRIAILPLATRASTSDQCTP